MFHLLSQIGEFLHAYVTIILFNGDVAVVWATFARAD